MFHFWALGFIGLEFFLPRCLSRSLNVYQQTVSNPDSNSIQLGEATNELSSDQDVPPSPIKVQVFTSSIIPCRWEPTSCQRALIHNRFRLIREGGIRLSFLRGRIPLPQSELFIYRLWHLFPSLRKALLNYSFSNVCVRSDDIQIQLTTVCLNILLDSWPSQCFNSGSCSKHSFQLAHLIPRRQRRTSTVQSTRRYFLSWLHLRHLESFMV